MARPHLFHFPSPAYSPTLHKLQTVPLSSSSSFSFPYNNKPNTHLPSRSISFLSLARYPLSVSSSVANVASRTEPEAAESNSGEEEGTGEGEYSNTRLLASNIPFTCTREDVCALFEKFGTVVDIEEFEGRVLKMNWAKPRKKESSRLSRELRDSNSPWLCLIYRMMRKVKISGSSLFLKVPILDLLRLYSMATLESLLDMVLCASKLGRMLLRLLSHFKGRCSMVDHLKYFGPLARKPEEDLHQESLQ